MLNCVYHLNYDLTNELRVVEDDEKENLLATGVWFDHPVKAKEVREKYEKRILDDEKRGRRSSAKQNESNGS